MHLTYKERARFARSLLVRAWRCLNGMDDIIIMHCTVPRVLTILYCTCSDLQFMFIPLASLVLVGYTDPFPETFNFNDHFHIVNLLQ